MMSEDCCKQKGHCLPTLQKQDSLLEESFHDSEVFNLIYYLNFTLGPQIVRLYSAQHHYT